MKTAGRIWMAVGAVLAVWAAVTVVREMPAMRRELRILRM
jgi:hypothetical protein